MSSHYYNIAGPVPPLEDVAILIDSPLEEGPDEIFKGLLPKGGQVLIVGETNVGKSLTSLEIISSFTTGQPLWGELRPAFLAQRVLYVLGEHQDAVIQKLWRKTQLPLAGEVFLLGPEALGVDKWLVAKGQPNLAAIGKFKRWAEGCDLIVFDPLSSFITGADVEQDNVTMRLLLETMSLICMSSGAACIVLAHQGKPQMDQFGKEHARRTYATRGASATEDAATNIFYLNTAEGDPGVKADGLVFELRCRKFKGDAPPERRLLRNSNTLTHTMLGNRPASELQKISLQGEIARLQGYNAEINYRTAIKIVAAIRGMPEETVKRHLGVL